MKSFVNAVFVIVLGLGVLSGPAWSQQPAAQLTKDQVKALIESAKTPADHMKIAEFYRAKASSLESEAAEHDEMIASYKKNTAQYNPKFNMVGHCQTWAKLNREAAAEATKMAIAHEDMAKSAK
jgi:hypothetical protein